MFVYGYAMGALSTAFLVACFLVVRKTCPGKGNDLTTLVHEIAQIAEGTKKEMSRNDMAMP